MVTRCELPPYFSVQASVTCDKRITSCAGHRTTCHEAGRGKALTQMVGQMKRCRPALEGQANSNLMDPLALQGAKPVREFVS